MIDRASIGVLDVAGRSDSGYCTQALGCESLSARAASLGNGRVFGPGLTR